MIKMKRKKMIKRRRRKSLNRKKNQMIRRTSKRRVRDKLLKTPYINSSLIITKILNLKDGSAFFVQQLQLTLLLTTSNQ